jgi:acyl-CoA thioester hydrolase
MDSMGIVHHSVYLVWFEEGRSHHLRSLGSDYAALETSGYYLTVTEVQARYLAPARYGQRVTVRTRVESLRSRSLSMTYQVVDAESDHLLVTGRTKLVCITRRGQVARIPPEWRQTLLSVDDPAK